MDSKKRKALIRAVQAAGLILLAAFLLKGSFGTSSTPRFPQRKPVHFWHMWTAEWKPVVEELCKAFNESQDLYEVIPLSLPADSADSKFLLSAAGGDPPDCMVQWHQLVPQFAQSGLLRPIEELMSRKELEVFRKEAFPVTKKIATYDGKLYCMPLALDSRACYYRLDQLKEAGLIPASAPARVQTREDFLQLRQMLPRTLEELTDWGEQLHRFDARGRLTRLGFLPQQIQMFSPVFGGGFYDWDTEELTISTPENRRALTWLNKRNNAVGFENAVRFQSSLAAGRGGDWPFVSGKISITVDGQWRVRQLKKFAPDIPYITGPVPPPKTKGQKEAGWVFGNFMIIPQGAENPEGAWEFTKFWTGQYNPEQAAAFYTHAGWLPPSSQIAETEEYRNFVRLNPCFQTFIDILASPNIEPPPPVPFQLLLFDRLKHLEESVMRGVLTPRQALKELEKDMQEELIRWKGARP